MRMTRSERKMHDFAEVHWPGSGEHVVTIYRGFSHDRGWTWAAWTIQCLLLAVTTEQRLSLLRELEERLTRSAWKPPPEDKRAAAEAAIKNLRTMLEGR